MLNIGRSYRSTSIKPRVGKIDKTGFYAQQLKKYEEREKNKKVSNSLDNT